jgi:hypothetical protein
MPLTTSPWLTGWRDRTDNVLYMGGAATALNPPEFSSGVLWFNDVILSAHSRLGEYRYIKTLGGPDLNPDAGDCAWLFARYGYNDPTDHNWTGTCPTPIAGPADTASLDAAAWSVDYTTSAGGSELVIATTNSGGRFLKLLAVRDNLGPRGVLSTPDPVADGYPFDSDIEWESGRSRPDEGRGGRRVVHPRDVPSRRRAHRHQPRHRPRVELR